MTAICWWLVDALAHLLEPAERDAVRGDVAEDGETAPQALREIGGLVIRRQAALWMDWRPWLGLGGLVVPLGLLFSLVSRSLAEGSAIYWWFYVNNWTWGYLESPGARHDLVQLGTGVLRNYLTLACWSWTTGFVLGSLSRRTIAVNGALLCLVLFVGTFGTTTTGRANPSNAVVFSLTFYAVFFPLMLRTVLVVIPALSGMRRGARVGSLTLLPTILWAVVITTLTALTARGLEYSFIFAWLGPGHVPRLLYPGPDGVFGTADDVIDWRVRLLPVIVMWPVGYMLTTSTWRRWRKGPQAARSN
jgi:hypothetical protein